MAEEPPVERDRVAQVLQVVGQGVRLERGVQPVLHHGRRAVRGDDVHAPAARVERRLGLGELAFVRHLLRPPAPALRAPRPVDGTGAAEREQPHSLDIENLPAHQMEHLAGDAVDEPTVPFLDRICVQALEVLVVSVNEQDFSEGLIPQPPQPIALLGVLPAPVPDQPEVAADHEEVVLGRRDARLRKPRGRELPDVEAPVDVAGEVDGQGVSFLIRIGPEGSS